MPRRSTRRKPAPQPFPDFEGFYQRTAYLVEENYAKMEELHFLRIEQAFESPGADPKASESRAAMSELAGLFLKLRVALEQSVNGRLVSPAPPGARNPPGQDAISPGPIREVSFR